MRLLALLVIRTYRIGWLACCSIFGIFPPSQQIEFRHCRWGDRLMEDALTSIAATQEPSDWVERASSVVPWIVLLGRKVLAVPATSAAPERMFSSAGNIMTEKRARLSCDHLEELMYLYEVWPKVREWTAIKKPRLAQWLHVTHTRTHTHKHTHANTKNPLGRIPCFFVVTNNKYQKRNRVHFRDSLSLFYKYMNTPYMIKFVSLYTHTNTDACLGSFLSVLWIVYFPFETLIVFNMYTSSEHIH